MADNIERTIQFIIEQQAKFSVDIQKLQETQEANTTMIRQLVDVSMSLARHGKQTDRRIKELAEDTDQRIKNLVEAHRELVEAQAHSDRRLDALIDVVDKIIHHNEGASPS